MDERSQHDCFISSPGGWSLSGMISTGLLLLSVTVIVRRGADYWSDNTHERTYEMVFFSPRLCKVARKRSLQRRTTKYSIQ
jgi:hypothetical protein